MKIKITLLVALLMCLAASQASANLLSDSGFENGGSAIVIKDGPWTWSGGANGDSFYDNTAVMGGSKAAKVVIWGGGASDYAYFNEDFTGIDYSTPYTLNGYFLWNSADTLKDGSSAKLQVKWMNSLGNVIRTDESPLFDNSFSADAWHRLAVTTSAPPAGTAKVSAVVALTTGGSYSPNSTVWVDDMSFTAIPEPASMALFSCGLAGLFGLGRKKRN